MRECLRDPNTTFSNQTKETVGGVAQVLVRGFGADCLGQRLWLLGTVSVVFLRHCLGNAHP